MKRKPLRTSWNRSKISKAKMILFSKGPSSKTARQLRKNSLRVSFARIKMRDGRLLLLLLPNGWNNHPKSASRESPKERPRKKKRWKRLPKRVLNNWEISEKIQSTIKPSLCSTLSVSNSKITISTTPWATSLMSWMNQVTEISKHRKFSMESCKFST